MLKVTLIAQGQQPVVIFDETKARPSDYCREGFKPESLRQFQNTPLVRGAAPFLADRFNMYAKWDFTVTHTFATVQACQDFIGNRPAVARAGELQIFFQFGGASWMRYYKAAFLTVVRPVKTYPISADYSYTILMPSLFALIP
jgi:hypothetical protein